MNIISDKMIFFSCENCNYSTINKKDYKKHLQTKKHLSYEIMMSTNIMIERNYKCDCGREYLHRSSLNNHKKKSLLSITFGMNLYLTLKLKSPP